MITTSIFLWIRSGLDLAAMLLSLMSMGMHASRREYSYFFSVVGSVLGPDFDDLHLGHQLLF